MAGSPDIEAQAGDRHPTFRNGSLRCALFPENMIPPAGLYGHRRASPRTGCSSTEVKRSEASHEGEESRVRGLAV